MTRSLAETPLRPSRTAPTPLTVLAALAGAAAPSTDQALGPTLVGGITLRAQRALPGDLFVALPSLAPGRPHGADFAELAVRAGAVAVLTDPPGVRHLAGASPTVPVLVHPDPRSVVGALSAHVQTGGWRGSN